MENTIYRLHDTTCVTAKVVNKIEFYCMETNTVKPTYDTRELGICVTNNEGLQIDFSVCGAELKSLHKYINDLVEYSEWFNSASLAKYDPEKETFK